MRPRSWHAMRGGRSGDDDSLLALQDFQQRVLSLQHYTRTWGLPSGGSLNTLAF